MYTLSAACTSKASAATNGTRSAMGRAKTPCLACPLVVGRDSEPYCAELIMYRCAMTVSYRLLAHAIPSAPWMFLHMMLPTAVGATVPLSWSEPTIDVASFESTHTW